MTVPAPVTELADIRKILRAELADMRDQQRRDSAQLVAIRRQGATTLKVSRATKAAVSRATTAAVDDHATDFKSNAVVGLGLEPGERECGMAAK